MSNEKTAVIIGAGPAGLTAAYEILKNKTAKVIILEESEFIGGISRTAVHNGNRMDIGGHRFFTKNEEVMKLWLELMPRSGAPSFDDKKLGREKALSPGGPDPEKEDEVFLVRDRVSRIFYLRKFFDYPISLKLETIKALGFGRTMKAGFGYIRSAIFKREENSLEDFMINRFGYPLYKMFFEDYTEKVWGRNPKDISADWGAQRIKGLSLMKAIKDMVTRPFRKEGAKVETSLIESFNYPKKGPGQLWETLADRVVEMGAELHMNTSAVGFEAENGKMTAVKVKKGDEISVIKADAVFSSMPVKDLVGALDNVPDDVAHIAAELPYRDFITVGLLLNKLQLTNKTKMKTLGNIVPDCWIYIQEADVKIGRLQIFNNWSPYMVKNPEETVWIGLEYFCNEGDELWNMEDKKFIDFAADELMKAGIIDKKDVLDSVRINVKKAYPAYFGTYKQFDKVKDYLNTYENLYCVGRNGQHRYNNMDHSMLTSIYAARAFAGNGDKQAVWEVNTDEEYHENKKG